MCACAAGPCRDANIVDVSSYDELKAAVAAGKWARGGWAGSDKQEGRIKEETQVSGGLLGLGLPSGWVLQCTSAWGDPIVCCDSAALAWQKSMVLAALPWEGLHQCVAMHRLGLWCISRWLRPLHIPESCTQPCTASFCWLGWSVSNYVLTQCVPTLPHRPPCAASPSSSPLAPTPAS